MEMILNDIFSYLNGLEMKDTERRDMIHKLIQQITNKDSIIKSIIIFNTLFDDDECNIMKNDIDMKANEDKSTFVQNPSVSRIPNPFMVPGKKRMDLIKSIKCLKAHLFYKNFGPETDSTECMPQCPNCTLRTSLGRLTTMYGLSLKSIMNGNNKEVDILSEILYDTFKENYVYNGNNDKEHVIGINSKLEALKTNFIGTIGQLPKLIEFKQWKEYPQQIESHKLNFKLFDSKFITKLDSELFGIIEGNIQDETQKKDLFKKFFGEDVISNFKKVLCRYNIIDELKKRYIILLFEDYYNLIEDIKKPLDKKERETTNRLYIKWCNKQLYDIYKVHGINSDDVPPSYLFSEDELNKLVYKKK